MKKKLGLTVTSFLVVGVLLVPVYFRLKAQTRDKRPDSTNQAQSTALQEQVEREKSTYPVIDFSYADETDPTRKARGRKFNNLKAVHPNTTENTVDTDVSHWEELLTALPVERSNVIVLGTVVGANAFLSENKASVYSEFKIKVERVLKNDTKQVLNPGEMVLAERPGGVVRYPTGCESWYRVEGQGMPILNGRYLFFLAFKMPGMVVQSEDLMILTAYNVDGPKVEPLDFPSGGTHPIARLYKGKDFSVLMQDLSAALSAQQK